MNLFVLSVVLMNTGYTSTDTDSNLLGVEAFAVLLIIVIGLLCRESKEDRRKRLEKEKLQEEGFRILRPDITRKPTPQDYIDLSISLSAEDVKNLIRIKEDAQEDPVKENNITEETKRSEDIGKDLNQDGNNAQEGFSRYLSIWREKYATEEARSSYKPGPFVQQWIDSVSKDDNHLQKS